MSVPELVGARRLRQLLDARGIRPSKALGQNFVIDPNTIRKVVDAAGLDGTEHVLEIGAGAGSLTLGLAAAARRVTAIEVDRRLLEVAREVTGSLDNVEVVAGDALDLDLASIDATRLVANLPYNVAATVVLRVLEEAPQIESLTVMTQREVGERLAAPSGSKVYGQTSVLAAYWSEVRVAARISRRAFYPVPNVDSVLVVLERRARLPDVDRDLLFAVVRAAFGQRRKTLRNSLAEMAGSTDAAMAAVRGAGLLEMTRPEQVSLEEFVALATRLASGPAGREAEASRYPAV
jgi:16S rRNA (adenine1518-N6/adenine1519-N6)-dimethyltransferase